MRVFVGFCILAGIFHAQPILAQTQSIPVIVISASRTAQDGADVASSVTVISREDLEAGLYPNVAETLRGVVGLDVAQSGPQSGASVFMRGAKSEHTLVLIDGVDVSHPGLNGRSTDLTHMNLTDVERIEVVRGPQSVLFGSNAIGGVINIITRRTEGGRFGARLTAGNYGTLQQELSASYKRDAYHARASVTDTRVEGISAASEKDGNIEKDGAHSLNASIGFGYDNGTWKSGLDWRHYESESDLDNFGGPGGDDPNYTATQRTDLATLALGHTWSPAHLSRLTLSQGWYEFDYVNKPDTAHPLASDDTSLEGARTRAELQHDMRLGSHTVSIGAEQTTEKASSVSRLVLDDGTPIQSDIPEIRETRHAYFLQETWKTDLATLTAGVRRDEFEETDGATTHRFAALVPIVGERLRIKGSYGTGFNAPSVPQRYGFGGNRALKPERSRGWDAGVMSDWSAVGVEAMYFENEFEDMIDYDFATSLFGNIARAKSRGVETALWTDVGNVRGEARYTVTHTEDKATGLVLMRRPQDKFQADLTWRPVREWLGRVEWQKVGRRRDVTGHVAGYELLNVKTSYHPLESTELFIRVDNALDEEYEEVDGYGTYGRRYYGGVALTL